MYRRFHTRTHTEKWRKIIPSAFAFNCQLVSINLSRVVYLSESKCGGTLGMPGFWLSLVAIRFNRYVTERPQ